MGGNSLRFRKRHTFIRKAPRITEIVIADDRLHSLCHEAGECGFNVERCVNDCHNLIFNSEYVINDQFVAISFLMTSMSKGKLFLGGYGISWLSKINSFYYSCKGFAKNNLLFRVAFRVYCPV
jgi:hypothetical protein